MAKRKRENADGAGAARALKSRKEEAASSPKQAAQQAAPAPKSKESAASRPVTGKESKAANSARGEDTETTTIQIITGSYERVLHGFIANIPRRLVTGLDRASGPPDSSAEADPPKVNFSDTFLFHAHTSAIRCLALSPPTSESSKVTLATGSTDERINLYSLSTSPPAPSSSKSNPQLPTLNGASIAENSKNKELGSLLHHSSSITALYFPTRAKLISSAEDSTITITRTRDWTPLDTIKAPIPKPQGRPSGDTAAPGEVPAGINDFAVHPSQRLMVSVSKGEKCMRLWNLLTGKKAGVLNFGREILASVGEGRFGTGEGRRVVWDGKGDEFAVAFERGVVVFDIDSKPKAKIMPQPRTKVHQMHYLPSEAHPGTLLVSTEDGRIMVYDTNSTTPPPPPTNGEKTDDIPSSNLVAQIGGPATGISGRVKDFDITPFPAENPTTFLIIAASSDGTVRLWNVNADELKSSAALETENGQGFTAKEVGNLLGTYSTGTRITCLKTYIMTGKPEEAEDEEDAIEQSAASSNEDSE